MRLTRRMFLAGLACSPLTLPVRAAESPSGPIRLIVPFPPGGSVDAVARILAPGLQSRLGTPIIIENIAGASGSIGAAAAARAAPDGNTWLMVFDSHAVIPSLMPDLRFDVRTDLLPVYLIGTAPHFLATAPAKSYQTLGDVITAARSTPDTITYGSVGTGSVGHLTMVRLADRAGLKLVHVPYKGGGPLLPAAIGGHVDLIISSAALLSSHVKAGKLRPIVQTGKERLAAFPDIPTAAEALFPGLESHAWWAVFAPKGTPQPMIERFASELRAVMSEEKVAAQFAEGQQMTLVNGGPAELKTFFDEQMETWRKVIKDNNIKPDS